ncbi:glycosyltransferase family 4 protein [Flavobacterium sp. ANB]|uniref:glycosyltransferase family 4 protein n=1 Tax=unclassified Flavobacterium TaxID=196869 RepID=UPI0012BA01D9|nr:MULTISPECIES: glycosyltransferase family 4 protein [unclassified Flavobacterium]MBF4517608.1 glycosyltransferase family 4 protein [Flavobacterium sp. ANB]MTD70335.1 glycosyltransferase [Flavobacterium sp. LC2016-13]
MKILFVSQYFYPETFKGNDIVFDLVKKGHEVTVLTAKPNYPGGTFFPNYSFFNKSTEIIKGAKVIRTPIYPRKNGKGTHLILNYLSFIFFSYFACIFRVKGKFDVIFVQQLSPVTMALPGLWLKKKKKSPVYLWVLDLWPESILAASNFKNIKIIQIIEKLVRYIYNNSDVILISSKYFENSIVEKLKDKSKKVIYFPNWAEDIFTGDPQKEISVPNLPNGFNIMFAGNVGESQDFETILKAAHSTKDQNINWIIVGDGRKLDWVKNEINEKKIANIHLFGRYEIEAMPLFFKKADVMLVSLKDEPVFALTVPAKVQAYMSSGKIILGVLNGEGNKLINDSKCGFAVAAGDEIELAKKAIELKNMTVEEKLKMEYNAKSYYENNFSKKMLLDKLESLFLKNIK